MTKVTALKQVGRDLSTMNNDELSRAIRAQLRLSTEAIEELGRLVREARRRNMSLAEFSTGMPKLLVHVADGQLDAELVLKFCNRQPVLSALIGVPLDVQRAMVKGESIAIVQPDPTTGNLITEKTTLRRLNGPQARLVFADGRILSPAEQRKKLAAVAQATRKHRTARSSSASGKLRITADIESGDVIVSQYRIRPDQFAGAFKLLGYKIVKA